MQYTRATNSHNLFERWPVRLKAPHVCRLNPRRVKIFAAAHFVSSPHSHAILFVFKCGGYIFCAARVAAQHTAVCRLKDFNYPKSNVRKLPNRTDLHSVSRETSCLCFNVKAQEGRRSRSRVSVKRLTSGAVIADARCNLSILSLFTSLFFFLNYLKCYLSNNEIWKEKKKSNLSFLCIMAYVEFFEEKNVLCVLSFRGVKKSLLSVEMINFFFLVAVVALSFNSQRFSVVYCLERSQSQCISVDPVSVMYVCLTTLRNLSLDGI